MGNKALAAAIATATAPSQPANVVLSTTTKEVTNILSPSAVRGLRYIRDFLPLDECEKALRHINMLPLGYADVCERRMTFHFGSSTTGAPGVSCQQMSSSSSAMIMPSWLTHLIDLIAARKLITERPTQANIYLYEPGSGIDPHYDSEADFGCELLSLSLQGTVAMEFVRSWNIPDERFSLTQKASLFLEPGSLVVLKGDARYLWKHAIPKRLQDTDECGVTRPRTGSRISIVFRRDIDFFERFSVRCKLRRPLSRLCRMCRQDFYVPLERHAQFFCYICQEGLSPKRFRSQAIRFSLERPFLSFHTATYAVSCLSKKMKWCAICKQFFS